MSQNRMANKAITLLSMIARYHKKTARWYRLGHLFRRIREWETFLSTTTYNIYRHLSNTVSTGGYARTCTGARTHTHVHTPPTSINVSHMRLVPSYHNSCEHILAFAGCTNPPECRVRMVHVRVMVCMTLIQYTPENGSFFV